ncbi:hypothetical protein [Acinetobacter courvalinii]|uniref:hypothetical protein n=1 Tax=Acinetobacter courvalinii TaxID=280147 RepID=UPI001902ACBF|nr:hypothetical protein [Acinetobacter courvalinii]MBJ9958387.1 hypothetical protein [Acinetobacter courvalinii]
MTLISAAEATSLSNKNLESFFDFKERVAQSIISISKNGGKSTYFSTPPNTPIEFISDYINELNLKGYKVESFGKPTSSILIAWD